MGNTMKTARSTIGDPILGAPGWGTDEYGVSHLIYSIPQGIERIIRGVAAAVERLSDGKLFFIPRPALMGQRNRTEWCLVEYRVGTRYNEDKGKDEGGFGVRVELRDFGSECPPPIKGTWPDRVLHVLNLIAPLERMIMLSCYTPEGYYLGGIDDAMRYYGSWGLTDVQPVKVAAGVECAFDAIARKSACAVGYDPEKKAWVGWSHRAACVFKIGHVVEEGNCEASSGYDQRYIEKHPEMDLSVPVGFEVVTVEDSKRCAIAFAESVG